MSLWIGELCVSIIMMIIAAVFFVGTLDFKASINPVDIGSAAFPRLMIVLILLFAAGQIALTLKNRRGKEENIRLGQKRILLGGLGLLLLYAYSMPVVGYFYVTPVFIFLLLLLQGNRRWIGMAAISLGFDLFAYLVFFRLLRVMLP